MTGFGSRELDIMPFGKIRVELRSTNHKFLETVFHLPEGLISLEDKIKREIEAEIKRGRLGCVISISGGQGTGVSINKALLKNYIQVLKGIKKQFKIKDEISINTLLHLPGVLAQAEDRIPEARLWPFLKALVKQALEDLVKMRHAEGRSLARLLKNKAEAIKKSLDIIRRRFKKAIEVKLATLNTAEECSSFLKETDITEEIERLAFHIKSFRNKLSKKGPVGKELDFIAQEMQREANTMGAKSFDVIVSSLAVQIKSQIEKIREQVQNIE
jgi:uncharacterized protein (TIGR00255 family)